MTLSPVKKAAITLCLAATLSGCAGWMGLNSRNAPTVPTSVANTPTKPSLISRAYQEPKPRSPGVESANAGSAGESFVVEQQGTDKPKGNNADLPTRLPLFRDWPKPEAVVIFSGQQRGYLEPCGCSPEFQKGGLARRQGFIKSLQKQKWPVVMVDLGGLLDDHSQQPPEGKYVAGQEQGYAKLEVGLEALQTMGYTALNLAPEDIAVQNGFMGLLSTLANVDNPPQPRGLNANLGIDPLFTDPGWFQPYITRKVGSKTVTFIGMVGEKYKDRMIDPEFKKFQTPEEALAATLKKVKQASQIRVLLLYSDLTEAKQLAKKFPNDLDVIIYGSDAEEPIDKPEFVGKTMLVTIGSKGKYTGAIGIFKDEKGQPRSRFELVPLDDRFPEDQDIRELLDVKYIQKLSALKLVETNPQVPFDAAHPEWSYVGSAKCEQCHSNVYKSWLATRHATALKTLVEGIEQGGKHIAKGKEANPECVSCHSVGFSYLTGYTGAQKTAHLGGNGCENCHGPSSEHVKIYLNPDASKDDLRRANKTVHRDPQTQERNLCIRCHDAENDPHFSFSFDDRWADIDHGTEAAEDKKLWPSIREKLAQPK